MDCPARAPEATPVKTVHGEDLVGLEYVGPFDHLAAVEGTKHLVIPWDDVTLDEGTGIVHIAPGCGGEDFELSKVHELDVLAPVDEAGRLSRVRLVARPRVRRGGGADRRRPRRPQDSLVDQRRTREQLAVQATQVETLKKYYELARLRYDNGYTSYIEVLDAERTLFNVELAYTQNQGVLFRALTNLYKAMGGGWVTEAEKAIIEAEQKAIEAAKAAGGPN